MAYAAAIYTETTISHHDIFFLYSTGLDPGQLGFIGYSKRALQI
jgi:hypothetical protein